MFLFCSGSTRQNSALRAMESAVADFALSIRRSVQTINENRFRRLVASLLAVPNISRVVLTQPSNMGIQSTVGIFSRRNQAFYELYWGDVNGRVEGVRFCTVPLQYMCNIMLEKIAITSLKKRRAWRLWSG